MRYAVLFTLIVCLCLPTLNYFGGVGGGVISHTTYYIVNIHNTVPNTN
jgi:hypothetical protein